MSDGETGQSEGAVEVLERLIAERDAARKELADRTQALKAESAVAKSLAEQVARLEGELKHHQAKLAEKRCGCGAQTELTKLPGGAVVCGRCAPIHAAITAAPKPKRAAKR